MPGQARIKGAFLIYHIIQRGNERKSLFLSDDDRWSSRCVPLKLLRAVRSTKNETVRAGKAVL